MGRRRTANGEWRMANGESRTAHAPVMRKTRLRPGRWTPGENGGGGAGGNGKAKRKRKRKAEILWNINGKGEQGTGEKALRLPFLLLSPPLRYVLGEWNGYVTVVRVGVKDVFFFDKSLLFFSFLLAGCD